MRYGVWREKHGGHYLASDSGETFVHRLHGLDDLRECADLANDGLALRDTGWRARLARRLLRIGESTR